MQPDGQETSLRDRIIRLNLSYGGVDISGYD